MLRIHDSFLKIQKFFNRVTILWSR